MRGHPGSTSWRVGAAALVLGFLLWSVLGGRSCTSDAAEQVEEDFRTLRLKLKFYADAYGGLPRSFSSLVTPSDGGGKLLSQIPHDPWGKPYRLEVEGKTFTISTDDPDQLPDTGDELSVSGEWTGAR